MTVLCVVLIDHIMEVFLMDEMDNTYIVRSELVDRIKCIIHIIWNLARIVSDVLVLRINNSASSIRNITRKNDLHWRIKSLKKWMRMGYSERFFHDG